MRVLLVITTVYLICGAESGSTPCKATDYQCLRRLGISTREKILNGVPALNIKPFDPIFLEEIKGDLPTLKYQLFNTTVIGYRDCKLSNLEVKNNITSLSYDMNCARFNVSGKYEMKGHILSLPVEGDGDFEFIAGKYFIHVHYELEKYQGKDGKTHIAGNNHKLQSIPLSPVTFHFKNLFNGREDLSEPVLKFTSDNWREVTEFIQDPIWDTIVKKFLKNLNEMLEKVPFENLIVY